MAVYTYKASDPSAIETTGTIAADTPRQARDLLRDRGLTVRNLAHAETRRKSRAPLFSASSSYVVTLFLRELSTLLSVGVPLLEAMETLAQQHHGSFRMHLLVLRDRVAAGSSLAGAMKEQPKLFDDLCVNITEVGEEAGTLDESLERLAEFRGRAEQLRGRIANALIYPALVLSVAIGATLFLMTFVVPRILEPLIEQGQPLPLVTRIVKTTSDFIIGWWWLLLATILIGACLFAAFIGTTKGRFAWHRFLLKLPLFGDLIVKQSIVRLCVVLGTLLRSGIPFIGAIQISQRSASNQVLRKALQRCENAISAGGDIAGALRDTGVFPPMVVQVFAVGQQSGKLEAMLDKLAATYDQEVTRSTQRLVSILEPMLIVVLALVVLVIVLATVLPILEAGNAIQ
jgi:type II secretory pathway component PulF